MQLLDPVAVGLVEGADHDPVGRHEVAHGRRLGEELGIGDVADVLEPTCVERGAHLLTGPDRHGALHDEHGIAGKLGEVVEDAPDVGEVRVAGVRRRRADADVEEVGVRRRLVRVERERHSLGVPLDELDEAGLVEREPSFAQRVDPLGGDIPDHDVVAELGEAGSRDDADPAGTEDPDLAHCFFPPSGRRPRAIESIVSLESVSRRVFTTQYVPLSVRSTTMWSRAPS